MPRYFIDTFDSFVVLDDQGVDLPDRKAVRREVHRVLAEMMLNVRDRGEGAIQLRADVRDENSTRIMTATLLLAVSEKD